MVTGFWIRVRSRGFAWGMHLAVLRGGGIKRRVVLGVGLGN